VHDGADPADQKICEASLADELAEVYVGLQEGFDVYSHDTAISPGAAVRLWTGGMVLWGDSAIDAMAPIHRLVHDHYDEDDEAFDV
jgi:hypothetical protein